MHFPPFSYISWGEWSKRRKYRLISSALLSPLFFGISNLIFLIPFHLLTVLICIEKQIGVTSDNLNLVLGDTSTVFENSLKMYHTRCLSKLDISNWHNVKSRRSGKYCFVLFWMSDGEARHRSVLSSAQPCRVMTHQNKSYKLEDFHPKLDWTLCKVVLCNNLRKIQFGSSGPTSLLQRDNINRQHGKWGRNVRTILI